MNDGLRRTPVHRALHRPNLLMGGDRELVASLLVICAALIVAAQNLPSLGIGLALYGAGVAALRELAKHDPKMRDVYLRHIRYAPFYQAREALHSRKA